MAPIGEAAITWDTALDLLINKKFDDARKLGESVQLRGKESELKTSEAVGALVVALSHLGKAAAQPGSEFFAALKTIHATWSEVAALLAAGGSGGVTGPWGIAANAAQTVSVALQKAGGDATKAFTEASTLSEQVGATWNARLTTGAVKALSSSGGEDEQALRAATTAPEGIRDPKQKATALLRASLAYLQLESPQVDEALRSAKEALASFRELGSQEGEGSALRLVSMACNGQSSFECLQAANQALKTFKEIHHCKGQAASIHSIAQAYLGSQSVDEAIFKCGEALKLSRQIGDRIREASVLETMTTANLTKQDGRKAVASASDLLSVSQSLGDKFLEAKALCFFAKAKGSAGGEDNARQGIQAAKDALSIYQELGLDMQSEAVEAMAAAGRGNQDPSEALAVGQRFADKFKQQGDKANEADMMFRIASIHLENKESDQALRAAQEALQCFQSAKDRHGEAKTFKLLAQIRLDKEEPGEAVKAAEQAGNIYRNVAFPTRETRDAEITCIKAMVDGNAMMGSIDEAARIARDAQRRFHSLKEKKGEGWALLSLAKLHLMRSETEDAMNTLVQAPPLFLAVGDKKGEGETWLQIGKIHLNKGEGGNAQRASEEAALAFRKCGEKKGRASSSQLVADVHFALTTIGAGNAQTALQAAQEAVSLNQELRDKKALALSLHILANAQLMTRTFDDALKSAQDAEVAFKTLRDNGGEAGSLLLQAGAYLGLAQYEECRRVAKEASDLFRANGDHTGEDSVEDFLDNVTGYEKGQLNRDDFRGFSMRLVEQQVPINASTGRPVAAAARKDRPPRRPRQIANISDIELIKADSSKETKVTLAFFDGFESRSAGGGARPAPKAEQSEGGFSKGFQDSIDKNGPPQKEQVLYTVRWVQAAAGKAATATGAGTRKVGRRDFAKEEDKRQTVSMSLGAPKDNWGSAYGKTNRLFEAAGELRGV